MYIVSTAASTYLSASAAHTLAYHTLQANGEERWGGLVTQLPHPSIVSRKRRSPSLVVNEKTSPLSSSCVHLPICVYVCSSSTCVLISSSRVGSLHRAVSCRGGGGGCLGPGLGLGDGVQEGRVVCLSRTKEGQEKAMRKRVRESSRETMSVEVRMCEGMKLSTSKSQPRDNSKKEESPDNRAPLEEKKKKKKRSENSEKTSSSVNELTSKRVSVRLSE